MEQKKQENVLEEDEKDLAENNGNLLENEMSVDNISQIDLDGTDQDVSGSPHKKNKTKLSKKEIEQKEEENEQNNNAYQFRAVGNPEKVSLFQCNMTEIFFELVGIQGGFHLRLESVSEKHGNQGNNLNVAKKLKQKVFQFTYDPILKRFIRELRDPENRDFLIDKNYLQLKGLRDHYKKQMIENNLDQNNENNIKAAKFANISYMQYLMR
jgi:hypothetical protein